MAQPIYTPLTPEAVVKQGHGPEKRKRNPNLPEGYDPASSIASPEAHRPAAAEQSRLINPEAVSPEDIHNKPNQLQPKPQLEVVPARSGELSLAQPEKQAPGQAVTASQVLSKIAGYQSTQNGVVSSFVNDPNFPNNLMNFIQNANASDASLWQAVLLLKIYRVLAAVFGG